MAGEVTNLSSTWSSTGRFAGDPYLMSLRGKDPKRTSTVTMHVAKHGAPGSNTSAGVRSHHFGPGVKVIGGQLQYAYEERAGGRIKVGKSPDTADILREYLRPPRPATSPVEDATASNSHTTATARPSTSYEPHTRVPPAPVDKVVYWDGTQHHIVTKSSELGGTGAGTGRQGDSQRREWRPPHLEHRDVEPGPFLGVRETGGAAGVSLIGSKYRLMPENNPGKAAWTGTNNLDRTGPTFFGPVPPPYGPNKGPYGLKPYAPVNATTSFGSGGNINEQTLRDYAAFKLVGHKQYEQTCKSLEGIQAWNAAQCDLTSSMSHGHSTRLMAPREHVVNKLSLRRGGF